MRLGKLLKEIDLFDDLNDAQVAELIALCKERRLRRGELLTRQGERGDEMYIITEGFVEVLLASRDEDSPRVIINLGPGQITGEMALIDQGLRSATVRAVSEPTIVQVIQRDEFEHMCRENTQIGYLVMRNLAADLVFKLRHRNLVDR